MTDQDRSTSLYVNNNGRIVCIAHAGSYLSSAYGAAPERDEYLTPLDHWLRIDDQYIAIATEVVGTYHPKCEDC